MNYKFKDGRLVKFDNGVIQGMGVVKGVATIASPIIGVNYIIKVLEANVKIPNDEYPFEYLTMFEVHLMEYEG